MMVFIRVITLIFNSLRFYFYHIAGDQHEASGKDEIIAEI